MHTRMDQASASTSYAVGGQWPSSSSPDQSHQNTAQLRNDPVTLLYLEKLPCLHDCHIAFECFFDDLQTFGNLPYVDRQYLDTLVERLTSARISLGELSYIFALIALAGISAPCLHPLSMVDDIGSRAGHKRNIDLAIQLLILSQDDPQVDMEQTLTRCHCQNAISSYWIQGGNLEQAWFYAEMANLNAKAIGLYTDNEQQEDTNSVYFHRKNRLRTDLLFNGRFSSFVLSKETSVPSIDYAIRSKPRKQDGSIDRFKTHLLQMKTSGLLIGMQITDFVQRFHSYTDEEERRRDALNLDNRLSSFVNSQSIQMLSLPDVRSVSLTDNRSSIHADRKLSVATSLLQMRILLTMPFLVGESQDATLQKNGFRAARGLLTSFGLINHMLRSPWVSSFSKLYHGVMIEKAMSVFVVGMEAFQSLASTTRSDITWFSHCFPLLYSTLTSTGLGGPNAFEAAKMLLPVPISAEQGRSLNDIGKTSDACPNNKAGEVEQMPDHEDDVIPSAHVESSREASAKTMESARESFEDSLRLLLLQKERRQVQQPLSDSCGNLSC